MDIGITFEQGLAVAASLLLGFIGLFGAYQALAHHKAAALGCGIFTLAAVVAYSWTPISVMPLPLMWGAIHAVGVYAGALLGVVAFIGGLPQREPRE